MLVRCNSNYFNCPSKIFWHCQLSQMLLRTYCSQYVRTYVLTVPKLCAILCQLFRDQRRGLAAQLDEIFQHCGLLIAENSDNKNYFVFRHNQHVLACTCSHLSTLMHCLVTYLSLSIKNIDIPYFPVYKTCLFLFLFFSKFLPVCFLQWHDFCMHKSMYAGKTNMCV